MSIHFQKLHSIFPTEEKTFFSQTLKNSASSVTDLRVLLNAEKALLSLLSEYEEMSTIAREILEAEGFTVAAISNSDVLHPIDGYNLIKRLGRVWPKVREVFAGWELPGKILVRKMIHHLQKTLDQFPSWEENRVRFRKAFVFQQGLKTFR